MKIKINNLTWEIKLISNENISQVENSSNKSITPVVPTTDFDPCGVTFRSGLTIFINDALNDDLFKRTLYHELTHAYCWSYGLTQFAAFSEENLCDFIETHIDGIYQLTNKIFNNLILEKHKRDKNYEKYK